MITPQEILMGREVENPLTAEAKKNLDRLLICVNRLRAMYGKPMVVSSGYRPAAINAKVGGAKQSHHMTCAAVDFVDKDGALAKWILSRPDVLQACALYLEDPASTKGWIHVQIYPPKSGRRIFEP